MRRIDNLLEQSRAFNDVFLWYNSFFLLDQVKMSGVKAHKHVL